MSENEVQPETSGLSIGSAAAADSSDTVTVTLEYHEGVPVLRAGEGRAIPATIELVDAEGNQLALYVAGTSRVAPQARSFGDDSSSEGATVQWQLPQALTDGLVSEEGETSFPLVPSRSLVVR